MELVWSGAENRAAQAQLEERLKAALPIVEEEAITFRPTLVNLPVHRAGQSGLWWACQEIKRTGTTPRFWNAFGDYKRDGPQRIAVEINIKTTDAPGRAQGFFARDPATGDIVLMHSGVMGGGKAGCARAALLDWLDLTTVQVGSPYGRPREGLVIGSLNDPDLARHISSFVQDVRAFKQSLDDDGGDR